MDPKTLTVISYVCLVIVSCYCLVEHVMTPQSEIGTLSFAIIAFGAALCGLKAYDESLMPAALIEAQKNVEIFHDSFILSFAAAEIWEKQRVRIEVVIFQMLLPFVPIALYISDKDYKKTLEYVVIGSLISFVTASILCFCICGILTAAIYAAGAFYLKDKVVLESVPQGDLKNYVDCLFCLFLLYTLDEV